MFVFFREHALSSCKPDVSCIQQPCSPCSDEFEPHSVESEDSTEQDSTERAKGGPPIGLSEVPVRVDSGKPRSDNECIKK